MLALTRKVQQSIFIEHAGQVLQIKVFRIEAETDRRAASVSFGINGPSEFVIAREEVYEPTVENVASVRLYYNDNPVAGPVVFHYAEKDGFRFNVRKVYFPISRRMFCTNSMIIEGQVIKYDTKTVRENGQPYFNIGELKWKVIK